VIGFELPVGDMTPFLVLPTFISFIWICSSYPL